MRPDGSAAGPLAMVSLSEYRRKRNALRNAAIDKRCSRKLEFNLGWADATEVDPIQGPLLTPQDHVSAMMTAASRCFRNLTVTESPSDVETDADSVFSSVASVSSISSTDSNYAGVSRFRHRYGRDGRAYVDRTLTADEKDEFERNRLKLILENPVLDERSKFDPRATEEEKPTVVDEFSIEYFPFKTNLIPDK